MGPPRRRARCSSWSAATTTSSSAAAGVRDVCRPDRAPRPPRQRPGRQDPEQPAVHREPGQRDQHPGTGRIPRYPPREARAKCVNRGSATSKALNSIAVFGGTLDGLAPIAGALLQKDVRHAASLAAAASAPEGAVFDAADAALDHGLPAMSRVGFVGTGRMGAPMVRRLVESGHSVRALGRNAEKSAAVRNSARSRCLDSARSPTAPMSSRCVCSPTTRSARSAWTTGCSTRCRRGPCSSCTPPAAPHGRGAGRALASAAGDRRAGERWTS